MTTPPLTPPQDKLAPGEDRGSDTTVVEQRAEAKHYNLPPGLKHSLPFYAHKRWVKLGEPIRLFEYLTKTFGAISKYRFMGTYIVFVNDPQYIREILINQGGSFVKERTLQRMKILLGEGLITSDDPIHMRQRKMMAPAFHRQRIMGYADAIVRIAAGNISGWQAGEVVDANATMMVLSLEIIARTLFDTEVTEKVRGINEDTNAIMRLYNFLVAFPKLESFLHLPIPGVVQFRRSLARLDAVVDAMTQTRRAEMADGAGKDRGDLLSLLVASRYEAEAGDVPGAAGSG